MVGYSVRLAVHVVTGLLKMKLALQNHGESWCSANQQAYQSKLIIAIRDYIIIISSQTIGSLHVCKYG